MSRRLFIALREPSRFRGGEAYLLTIVFCGASVIFTLGFLAEKNVRENFGIQILFFEAWLIALAATTGFVSFLGLDALGDGIDRNNRAARIATSAGWLGLTLCAVSSNLGNGDFVGSTFIPLLLDSAALMFGVTLYSATTHNFAPITIERDDSAGVRFAGFILGASLPLAKASSSDWISLEATLRDYQAAAPWLLLILALALGREWQTQRQIRRGCVPYRLIDYALAATLLGIGGFYVTWH